VGDAIGVVEVTGVVDEIGGEDATGVGDGGVALEPWSKELGSELKAEKPPAGPQFWKPAQRKIKTPAPNRFRVSFIRYPPVKTFSIHYFELRPTFLEIPILPAAS
jgi:hypothetical protein